MTYGGMFMRTFKRRSLLLLQKPLALCRADRKGLVLLRQLSLALRSSAAIFIVAMVCAMGTAQAFTNVQVAAGSPSGLESAFLAATTAQFTATVVTNPFFSGTYQVMLQGFNPLFNPAPKMQDLLNALVTVDSTTYVYGFGDGQAYERHTDLNTLQNIGVECSTDAVCSQAIMDAYNTIYQQNYSTPTAISGF